MVTFLHARVTTCTCPCQFYYCLILTQSPTSVINQGTVLVISLCLTVSYSGPISFSMLMHCSMVRRIDWKLVAQFYNDKLQINFDSRYFLSTGI